MDAASSGSKKMETLPVALMEKQWPGDSVAALIISKLLIYKDSGPKPHHQDHWGFRCKVLGIRWEVKKMPLRLHERLWCVETSLIID